MWSNIFSYIADENVNWYNQWGNSLVFAVEVAYIHTYDPAILLLGIYPVETHLHVHQDTYTSTFTAAFSIIRMSEKLETINMTINSTMNNKMVAYFYNRILYNGEINPQHMS